MDAHIYTVQSPWHLHIQISPLSLVKDTIEKKTYRRNQASRMHFALPCVPPAPDMRSSSKSWTFNICVFKYLQSTHPHKTIGEVAAFGILHILLPRGCHEVAPKNPILAEETRYTIDAISPFCLSSLLRDHVSRPLCNHLPIILSRGDTVLKTIKTSQEGQPQDQWDVTGSKDLPILPSVDVESETKSHCCSCNIETIQMNDVVHHCRSNHGSPYPSVICYS